jgi:murein DD-endopeptidase MepM/ murein hydrolase activator NlpD
MARALRLVAVAASAGILLGAQATVSGGGEAATPVASEPNVTGVALAADDLQAAELGTRIVVVTGAIAGAEADIAGIDQALAPLEVTARQRDPVLESGRTRLRRETDTARARISSYGPARAPSVEALAETLQSIATALNANDLYRGALVERLGTVVDMRIELENLAAQVRSVRFELERYLADLHADLTTASQTEWSNGAGDDAVVEQLRSLVGRAQSAELTLRRQESRILALSVALGDEQSTFREGMRSAQRTQDDLYAEMISAEGNISAMVGDLFGQTWDGQIIPGGVLQVCPVDPPNAYTDDFGAPRYAGGYHPHAGNDIFAAEGTPIRAPFPGNAVDTSNTLGGMAVSVYGVGGHVYNAHLSAFGKLGPVEAGEIIGYVGNSGDAITTPPHDHFEWHPDNGPAINPYPFLNAVCRPEAP